MDHERLGPRGGADRLRPGYSTRPTGRPGRSSDTGRQTDHYTFAGTGTETYAPHFNYAGFRYAEVTGLPDGATVTVTAQAEHTDVPTTGRFTTSNALLNTIQGDAVLLPENRRETYVLPVKHMSWL